MKRLVSVLAVIAAPAVAQGVPAVQPTRDVDVTYRVPVPGGGDTSLLQRYRWSASVRKQRLDMPTRGDWMVLDFAGHRFELVRDESREVVDLPAPRSADQPGAGAGYTRVGSANVAGLPCTEWRTIDTRGQETVACYTDDGVLLRATAGAQVLTLAISVKYERQDPALFQPPSDYTQQHTSR